MTDNTSPVATLAASLPKGNGLTRAAGELHKRKGALVPFIGYLRVEEVGEDLNDVLKVKTTIQRLELCTGELERDAKSLVARASFQANSHPGQLALMAEPGTIAAKAEERDRYVGYLREWQTEQDPPMSDADAGQLWHNFSGGHYGPLDQAAPEFVREFLLEHGALPDEGGKPKADAAGTSDPDEDLDGEPTDPPGPEFSDGSDSTSDPDGETAEPAAAPGQADAAGPKKPAKKAAGAPLTSVPS